MPQPRGYKATFNAYEETTYATPPVTPSAHKIYCRQYSLKPMRALLKSETLTGNRGPEEPDQDVLDVAGNIPCEIGAENIGLFLKHLFGEVATTGAGPYSHVFTPGALPVGLTLEQDRGSVLTDESRVERSLGCKIASMQLQAGAKGYPTISWDIRGAKFVLATAPLDATPTDTGFTAFAAGHGTITEGGAAAAKILSMDMTINNDLDQDQYAIGGGGDRDDLPEGFCLVSGTFTARLLDKSLLDKGINGTVSSLKYALSRGTGDGSAGNEYLDFELEKLKYEMTGAPIEGPRGVVQTMTFQGFLDAGAFIKSTLKNAVATI